MSNTKENTSEIPNGVLESEVISRWAPLPISDELDASVDDIVSWKVTPPFFRVGRSALMHLPSPLEIGTQNGTVRVEQIKIKGVGLSDFEGNISQPSSVHFQMNAPHLGISEKGTFFMIPAATKPKGGLVLEKAKMEFHIADILFKNNIPTEIPLRVYKYTDPDMCFEAKGGTRSDLGVVVAGQHHATYDRADIMLDYQVTDTKCKAQMDEFAELVFNCIN
ncbi:MAG: hypothetical protein GKR95_19690 [Gammaproteobacteria bacterium]|nr:hypothetical protein [Gammaproteobacteria bacterium]